MTFGRLFRDVVSALDAPEDKLRFKDVTNIINQVISDARVEYIKAGQGYEFTVTETVYVTIPDLNYPFLYSIELNNTLMRTLPIQQTIKSSVFKAAKKKLANTTQTWSKGDLAIKGKKVYECLADITDENTFDKTFEPVQVRNYYVGNNLKYTAGDVVYDKATDSYYVCDTDYTNNQGKTITASGAFSLLYWKELGDAFFEATYLPFSALYESKLTGNIKNHYPFSILDNKLYTIVNNTPFTITYIPEWEYIEDLTDKLVIPDTMFQTVRNRSVQLLASKLGISVPQMNEGED